MATIFTTPMAISRHREESSQSPTTGTKTDGSQPNGEYFCPGQLFSPTRVHTGTKLGTNQRVARKSTEQTEPDAKISEIFDLVAVNFRELVPISEYRGREAVA